jgi:hypothetical protein
VAPGPGSRDLVDEFEALLLELGKGFREIRDAIGNVVEVLAPFLQEASDSGFGIQRLQEFDGSDEADAYTLGGKFLYVGTGSPGQEFE